MIYVVAGIALLAVGLGAWLLWRSRGLRSGDTISELRRLPGSRGLSGAGADAMEQAVAAALDHVGRQLSRQGEPVPVARARGKSDAAVLIRFGRFERGIRDSGYVHVRHRLSQVFVCGQKLLRHAQKSSGQDPEGMLLREDLERCCRELVAFVDRHGRDPSLRASSDSAQKSSIP